MKIDFEFEFIIFNKLRKVYVYKINQCYLKNDDIRKIVDDLLREIYVFIIYYIIKSRRFHLQIT